MSQFQTLVWREWRQNRRGWMTLLLLPTLLMLALLVWSAIQGHGVINMGPKLRDELPPAFMVLALTVSLLGLQGLVVAGGLVVQAGGLARRDRQDRSIEFWQALPVSDTKSVLATLVTHWLLWPLAAAWITLGLGLVVGLVGVVFDGGVSALAHVAWGPTLDAMLHSGLRFTVGYPMALLWISPVILAVMTMSAWFGRWGFPGLIMATVGTHVWLRLQHGSHWVGDVLRGLSERALLSVLPSSEPAEVIRLIKGSTVQFEQGSATMTQALNSVLPEAVKAYKQWIWQSLEVSVSQLIDQWALSVLLLSAALVALMVLRRSPRRLVVLRWVPAGLLKASGH